MRKGDYQETKSGGQKFSQRWVTGLLKKVRSGELSVQDAVSQLSVLPYEDMMHAKLDHHRSLRTGFPEVVFGPGKTREQLVSIANSLAAHSGRVLITRVDGDAFRAVKKSLPDARYNAAARAVIIDSRVKKAGKPGITIVTGGTADIPVAEEAAVTAEMMGNKVERIFDVGVAGIHRLFDHMEQIRSASVIIAVAGMDGVLPAVLGGLVTCPVIAVPTSVGYGACFKGIAPLLTMLNSCAPGIAVVNIDGGFNAGYLAGLINR
ncbi:MAG: nickel pincer cofactor biosynthesis protein LarB [Dehalococcoidia bacterium]|nr:nickel pincer cofactor biosynthesis protein LarB [Dehalococcoidia bacterium]